MVMSLSKCSIHGTSWSPECDECESKAPESARGRAAASVVNPTQRQLMIETIQCALRHHDDAGYRADAAVALNELSNYAKALEAETKAHLR